MFARIFIPVKLRRASALFWKEQSGAVLALVAIVIVPVLIGSAALAVDLGFAFSRQRQMQVAADAAAYSGAASLVQTAQGKILGTAYYAQEAQNTAAAAGFTNGVQNITVTPSLGTANFANDTLTVTISEQRNWILARLFLATTNFTSTVRAVAKVNQVENYCMVALGCSAKGYGIIVQGNTSVTSPNGACGMMSNCTSNCSITQKGSANDIGMPVYAAGGDCVSGQSTFNVTQNAYKSSDPFVVSGFNSWLKSISWPNSPSNWASGNGPGFYKNFNVPNGITNLAAGIYYIEGNLTINGTANLTGSNVTLILGPNASVSQTGNTGFTISAPSTGPTAGVVLAGLGASTASLLGNSGFGGTGSIYFPNAEVDFQGNNASGAGGQCVQIVANVLAFQGSSNVQDSCPNAGPTAVNFKIRLIQ